MLIKDPEAGAGQDGKSLDGSARVQIDTA